MVEDPQDVPVRARMDKSPKEDLHQMVSLGNLDPGKITDGGH